jgi:hypothetical protein
MSMKDDLRRRRAAKQYPRRSAATFTDEDDHNPQVLQDCATCHGSGKDCRHEVTSSGGETYMLDTCAACRGSGVTGQVEPYFSDLQPEASACADDRGWVTCPGCDWRFAIRDRRAWTGRRHLQCGQKISIIAADGPTHGQPPDRTKRQ